MDWMDQLEDEKKTDGPGDVRVVHVNTYTKMPGLEEYVYVGRSVPGHEPSVLGNPYKVPKNAPRGSTLEAYRKWLLQQMADKESDQRAEMRRLAELAASGKNLALACWCYPKGSCHAEIIKELVDKMVPKILAKKKN